VSQSFEDLRVWQESMNLAVKVMNRIGASRNFALRDQMMRSAISVPSNIAEGYERRSDRELIRFLRIAAGSNAELRTQLYLAKATSEINADEANEMIDQTQKVAAQLINFIKARQPPESP
jgi:four helix bundle protein